MELLDLGREALPRVVLKQAITSRDDPYDLAIDRVRRALLELLARSEFSLSTRLSVLGCLADRLSPFFHRGGTCDPERLEQALEAVSRPEVMTALDGELASIALPVELSSAIVLHILGARLKTQAGSFGRLVDAIARSFASSGENTVDGGRLFAHYIVRRDAWERAHAVRIDRYFTNYAMGWLFAEWYTSSDDLVSHLTKLFVRVATLRFLFFTHPALAALPGTDVETDASTLDGVAVEVVYKTTRHIDHNAGFVAGLETLVKERAPTFAHVMFLAKM